jgi:hypothetical protein
MWTEFCGLPIFMPVFVYRFSVRASELNIKSSFSVSGKLFVCLEVEKSFKSSDSSGHQM